jgi:hypothetical protein
MRSSSRNRRDHHFDSPSAAVFKKVGRAGDDWKACFYHWLDSADSPCKNASVKVILRSITTYASIHHASVNLSEMTIRSLAKLLWIASNEVASRVSQGPSRTWSIAPPSSSPSSISNHCAVVSKKWIAQNKNKVMHTSPF